MHDDQPGRMTPPAVPGAYRLRDGRVLSFRTISADDALGLTELCQRLSPESSRLRFFCARRQLSAQEAHALTRVDHRRCETFVAVDLDRVVALGGFAQLGQEPHAELTLLVEDAYQGHGVGRQLLTHLITAARSQGFKMLLAELLPENERALRLLETAGLPTIADRYFGVWRVHLFLDG